MVHSGRRWNHFACPGSDTADRADRLERLGLFLDGHSCTPAFYLSQTENRADGER